MAAKHFIGSFLQPSWAKVVSGELPRKVGVKVVTQPSKTKVKKNASKV